ncbi:unnamed protein product, partial [Amoebophrya sp. A120]|eukprot:GSA120T00012761001.1
MALPATSTDSTRPHRGGPHSTSIAPTQACIALRTQQVLHARAQKRLANEKPKVDNTKAKMYIPLKRHNFNLHKKQVLSARAKTLLEDKAHENLYSLRGSTPRTRLAHNVEKQKTAEHFWKLLNGEDEEEEDSANTGEHHDEIAGISKEPLLHEEKLPPNSGAGDTVTTTPRTPPSSSTTATPRKVEQLFSHFDVDESSRKTMLQVREKVQQ